MGGHDTELGELFAIADQELRHKRVQTGIWLYVAFMPLFGILDWIIYPGQFVELIAIRGIFIGIFLGFYAVTLRGSPRIINVLGLLAALTAALSIAVMIAVTEGANSPYYAGLNLIAVVMSLLLPWTIIETVLVTTGTLILYGLACWANTLIVPSGYPITDVVFNNVFFLVATSVICVVASHLQSIQRFNEFQLNQQLNKRNIELSQLDRLKSQFFANVSHELRTPLTLILSPIQDLADNKELPPHATDSLKLARDNGFRLLNLVNTLLDVIRLEEGSEQLAREPVDLNRIAEKQAEQTADLATRKGLRLERTLHDGPLTIAGDLGALERIVTNLLNNAVKFTDRGGWVRLSSRLEPGDGKKTRGRAVIEVADSGIGIEAAELPYIFDRFRQADGSATRRYRGTGLGLALVKELTEKLGGEVWARSEPGVGSTLAVALPLLHGDEGVGRVPSIEEAEDEPGREVDALEALHRAAARYSPSVDEGDGEWAVITADSRSAQAVEDASAVDRASESGEGERPLLLVVDDEPDMRRYLRGVLRERFRVVAAENGEEGLAVARRLRPALLLLDLMMPGIDGFEVTRRMRGDEALRGTRIILMTAKEAESVKLQALREGADDFIQKPFLLPELRARVGNQVDRARLFTEVEEKNRRLSETLAELHATEAHLIQSEKLNALGGLAAGLLHEINNPLNFTLMALEVARAEPAVEANEDLRETLADIGEGMGRIESIVRDLHAFAHPSAGDLEGRFAVGEAVASALQFTAHEWKGLVVEESVGDECVATGSRSHIVQVLINLITNGAKAVRGANRESVGKLVVSCEISDRRLEISVWDNGTGIDAETLPKVFDPFFTTRDVGDGMGMGLSICHTIVRNHGGNLRVESVEGEWTRFRFDLSLGG